MGYTAHVSRDRHFRLTLALGYVAKGVAVEPAFFEEDPLVGFHGAVGAEGNDGVGHCHRAVATWQTLLVLAGTVAGIAKPSIPESNTISEILHLFTVAPAHGCAGGARGSRRGGGRSGRRL